MAARRRSAARGPHVEKSNCFDGKRMQMTRKSLPFRAADASGSFVSTLTWLHAAAAGDAPLLVDRKLKLVPDLDGFALPNHLHWLLLPFSKRTVR